MLKTFQKYSSINLIKRMLVGLLVGITLGIIVLYTDTKLLQWIALFGDLFVGALKAIAPVLVFFLVSSALSQHQKGHKTNIGGVVKLYLFGTLFAALIAVFVSFLFPVTLILPQTTVEQLPPSGVGEVLVNLLMSIVQNPIEALATANYIGILFWGVLFGLALKPASESTKEVFLNISQGISKIVGWVINLAPFGIMGLVFSTITDSGLESLLDYGALIILLVSAMAIMAFVVNPILTFIYTRENPFPLVMRCLSQSGINAFFTRSSAANIPVNIKLCEELDVDPEMYNVTIPLGSTINMSGAAITITILTLAAANTMGVEVSFGMAFILSVVAAVSACGASGVAGGSLLLIPLACSLFGISNDIALEVVGVGFIIGIIQDSCETALNSSSDALYTIIVSKKEKLKESNYKI